MMMLLPIVEESQISDCEEIQCAYPKAGLIDPLFDAVAELVKKESVVGKTAI